MSLSRRLRELRAAADLSQSTVAHLTGIPRPGVSYIERGKRRVNSSELEKLARLYGTTPSDLLRFEPVEPEQARPAPVMSVDLLVAGLRDITAHLEAHVERRAAELAQPLITAAVSAAAKRVAAAEEEAQREKRLTAEVRRQLKGALRLAARLGHEVGERHDSSFCRYCEQARSGTGAT